jgi:hypothetical protein
MKGKVIMRKASFAVLLSLLLLSGLVAATGVAGDGNGEIIITPWKKDQTYHIHPGQIGVIESGWGACTAGLVRVYIKVSNYELALNGETILTPEQVDTLWGPIEHHEPDPGYEDVCNNKTAGFRASWRYALDGLQPGEYDLHSRIWIDHTLIDGGDYDGDGKPDLITPDSYYYDTHNTIVVE